MLHAGIWQKRKKGRKSSKLYHEKQKTHLPQWVGLSISQDLSNFMAYGVKILAHSGQMHNLGTLCILVNSFGTLGYISYNDLRSPETSKWVKTMGIRLSRVFQKIKKK